MVVDVLEPAAADRAFRALADRTRRDIVRRTLAAELSVSTIAEEYPMSFAAVQKHVAVLARAGLVVKRRQGREQLVRAEPAALHRAGALLAELESRWHERVDRMDQLLRAERPTGPPSTRRRSR
jgi:DNA-binding transcriptional ArsR family regulator